MKARRAPSGPFIKQLSFAAPPNTAPNSGAANTIDWSQSSLQRFTLDQSCVFTSTGLPRGEYVPDLKVELTQGAGGAKSVLFLLAKTPGGQGLNLSNTPTALDVLSGFWDGYTLFLKVDGLDWG